MPKSTALRIYWKRQGGDTDQGRHFLDPNRAMVTAIEQQMAARRHSGEEQVRAPTGIT